MAVEEVPPEAETDLESGTWSLQGRGAEEGRVREEE